VDIKDLIAGYLFNDETKQKIIDKLNDKVDVPFINEKTEEKVLNAVYEAVEEAIKSVLLK
jgi:nucleoid DNA-binding protein|tara:strand:- start:261 stop:440 length:180 start_codon:yes stop_codon:yes gene_type:complete